MRLNCAIMSAGSAPAVAVIKALRKQHDIDIFIYGLDMDLFSSGMYLVDKKMVIPPSSSPLFIKEVLEFCKKNNIQCLIPIIDEELYVFAKNKHAFEKLGIKLIVNTKEAIRLSKDKFLTYKYCRKNLILVPRTRLYSNIGNIKKFSYPLIIKPLDGRGSRDVIKIKDAHELFFLKRYYKNFILQEFIEGEEYTIDIVASPDGEILQAIPRQRIMVKAGMSYKGRIVKNPALIDYGRHIARKFGINGPANIQCIINKGDIYLIEVNPKFAAGLSLTIAAGVNIPLILIKLAYGLKIEKKDLEFRDGLMMLRYWEEVFV